MSAALVVSNRQQEQLVPAAFESSSYPASCSIGNGPGRKSFAVGQQSFRWVRFTDVGTSLPALRSARGHAWPKWTRGDGASDSTIGAPSTDPRAIWALKEVIDTFSARLPNWDGDGGQAPSEDAVTDGHAFVDLLSSIPRLPAPEVYAPGDGEVLFQWRVAGGFIEVGFPGDQTISWTARTATSRAQYGDDDFDAEVPQLPGQLIEYLSRLS